MGGFILKRLGRAIRQLPSPARARAKSTST
jgi:hypothetical protein